MPTSREPKRETTPPRIEFENLIYMIRDVVFRLDKLGGGRTIPRGRRNICKKWEITQPLRGSDKRLT